MSPRKRQKLFEQGKTFALYLAKKRSTNVRHLREDIDQEALLTLWQTTEKFKSSKGVKFTTFAQHRINGALLEHISLHRYGKRKRYDQKRIDLFKTQPLIIDSSRLDIEDEEQQEIPYIEDPIDKELRSIDIRDAMNTVLESLDHPKNFIMKCWLNGELFQDIAVKLNVTAPNISHHMNDIRRIIKARLSYLVEE